ncbi:hypothetical protein RI129_002756 [Pyrocoelia pectoralis]|uniref:Uncharacterized protein n=1 Tax=Pyrocoelia pectoralis TaxID=417401 RepID=A0AAN7VPH6_9COLE
MPKDANKTVFLAYFQEMSETSSPNSLWTKWSMLKSMKVDAFLKRMNKGYKLKKSAVLSPNKDVISFLKDAPKEIHLLHKVVLISYFGGCRSQELLNIKIADIEDRDSVIIVNVPESRHGGWRSSTVVLCQQKTQAPRL